MKCALSQPLQPLKVILGFEVRFHEFDLYRYDEELTERILVGLCTLNQVDP
jgi:hypothetical protein